MAIRVAVVRGNDLDRVAAYLPSNYAVTDYFVSRLSGKREAVIEGEDVAGWTFEDYVQPRLASGMMFASEVITAQDQQDVFIERL